jgi:hypothetical protein
LFSRVSQRTGNPMGTFSFVSSSTSEVVKALRAYLEETVPSDFASLAIDAQKPHKWHVTGTVFVDFIPVGVEVCAKTCDEEVSVTVSHTSHNDLIRFKNMFKQMVGFLQARGLQTSSNLPVSKFQPRLLDDDDFGFSDDEESTWDEKVQSVLEDTRSPRTEVREEAFRAIAQWASSSPASHEALAKGFMDRAAELSAIFRTSSKASAAETYPFAVAMRKLCEGCSLAIACKMLESPLTTMMDPASKPGVPAVVAREYNMAMRAIGKAEVSKPRDDFSVVPDISDKMDQVKKSIQLEHSEKGSYNSPNLVNPTYLFGEQHLMVGGH